MYHDDYDEIPEEVLICRSCGEFDDTGPATEICVTTWEEPVSYFYCAEAGAYVSHDTCARGCPGFILGDYGHEYAADLRDIDETYESLRSVR